MRKVFVNLLRTRPRSTVGNVSDCIYIYIYIYIQIDIGREFDPGPVPYFREDL